LFHRHGLTSKGRRGKQHKGNDGKKEMMAQGYLLFVVDIIFVVRGMGSENDKTNQLALS
jgi:hypothetical protein